MASELNQTADAVILASRESSKTADASVYSPYAVTPPADAVIETARVSEKSADAFVYSPFAVTPAADAVIETRRGISFGADAYLLDTVTTYTLGLSADSFVGDIPTIYPTLSLDTDAVIQGVLTASLTGNGIIRASALLSLTSSAYIDKLLVARSLVARAIVQTTVSAHLSALALIEEPYQPPPSGLVLLVNSAPGKSRELFKPTTPVFMGVRSIAGNILIREINASFGISNIRNHGVLPENDPILTEVAFTTPEGLQPVSGVVTKGVAAGSLLLTKTNDTDYEQGIYEVSAEPTLTASTAAYFRFRKKSWASFTPSWLGRPLSHGLYFALRDGNLNTGAFVFLQANGTVLLAGPIRSDGTRYISTHAATLPFPALPTNGIIELWITISRLGEAPPFTPSNVPTVEVWGAVADGAPLLLHREAAANLGISGRRFTEQKSTIFFGNAGRTGDILELLDWQLYPDFRPAIREYEKMPDHSAIIYPDVPGYLWARDGKLPTESVPARWFEIDGPHTESMETSFVYQPGRKLVPQMFRMNKTTLSSDVLGFERDEPRLGRTELNAATQVATKHGFMMEAFMASTEMSPDFNCFGSGFSVEDGSNIYRVATLYGGTRSAYGIHNGGAANDFSGHYGGDVDSDVNSLKVVRMVVDPHADKVYLDVDDERVVSRNLSTSTFPVSTARRVRFGHLASLTTTGFFNVASLLYVPNYETWDATSGRYPTEQPYVERGWTHALGGAGNEIGMAADSSYLTIKKGLVNTVGSHNYFMKDTTFPDYPGLVVDFGMKVHAYADYRGEVFAPVTAVGAGVKIWYGRRIELGFYSCGTAGRFIGIIPANGNANDIIYQTELGRQFSAQVDWTDFHNYRIVVRSFKSIEVWVDGFHTEPAISIPWNAADDCFDVPLDVVVPRVAFGHFGTQESSITRWKHFNYGGSNGYDVAMIQTYPEGLKPYHFDGKSLLFFSAKDTTDP